MSSSQEKTYKCGSLVYTRRGLIVMFAWLLWGDFCFTMMEAVVPSIVPLKMHSLGASDTLISLIMTSLPAVFNFSITPGVSIWSDRLRTSWGRRIPFILGSLPFLSLSLLMIGLNDDIAGWVHQSFFAGTAHDKTRVTIVMLAGFVAMFELFNMFVNTVFWYLFNDVVPEEMLARFMSQFRIVGTLAGMLYNFFIFRFAESHMREIYIGAAVLYFVGFGMVCLRVREGTYPPVEDSGEKRGWLEGLWEATKSFGRECFTSRYYWYFMLDPAITCLAAFAPFGVFLHKSMGLTLGNIGILAGFGQATMLISFFFVGRIVDRCHPVRSMAYFNAFGAFMAFGGWVWLFVKTPNSDVYLWIAALSGALFNPLFQSSSQVAGMTRWMRLLPREKLGQFSGAMCLIRAIAIFTAGFLAGAYIDLLKTLHPPSPGDPEGLFAYRYMFLFSGVITVAAFIFHYKVFRAWKRLGGDTSYEAPDSRMDITTLRPFPGDEGKSPQALIIIPGVMWLGSFLGLLTWCAYYWWWDKNSFNVMIFGVAGIVSATLFYGYTKFVRFMERP